MLSNNLMVWHNPPLLDSRRIYGKDEYLSLVYQRNICMCALRGKQDREPAAHAI
jgi:hypothetical protein